MIPIIEEMPSKQSFAHRLLGGIQNLGQQGIPAISEHLMGQEQRRQQAQAIRNLTGQDLGALPQDLQKIAVQHLLKGSQEAQKKIAPLQAGLQTVKRMRELGATGRLGRGAGIKSLAGGKTAKAKGEYEQLGKSLISLASTIPIRNRLEFETLAGKLHDATLPDNEREGILDAMERIITQNMQQYGEGSQQEADGIVEMRDSEGNVYDIPFELQEQARSQGLL